MKKGEIFHSKPKQKFAFKEISSGGCVIAFSYDKQTQVRFPRIATPKLLEKGTGEVDAKMVRFFNDSVEDKQEKIKEFLQKKQGAKFIGNDGYKYEFVKMNQKRFVFKDPNNEMVSYTAPPEFVKYFI